MSTIAYFVPSRFVVVIGALSTTFSYEMWNIFWMQVAYFASLAILFEFSRNAAKQMQWREYYFFVTAFIALVVIHLIDLGSGADMIRRWDDTELKELILAIGLCYYAVEIYLKNRTPSAASP